MTTTTAMTKLVCAECRHENEAERIYCHNCGERLDRSAVSAQKKAQDPQEVHRRLQKMLGPPNMARRNFFTVSKLALAAAVVAALVEIALPPELPAPTKAVPPQVDLDLERSEEHTSELQSPCNLVCRLLLEKKNKQHILHSPAVHKVLLPQFHVCTRYPTLPLLLRDPLYLRCLLAPCLRKQLLTTLSHTSSG